jgi:hypothetical protein
MANYILMIGPLSRIFRPLFLLNRKMFDFPQLFCQKKDPQLEVQVLTPRKLTSGI